MKKKTLITALLSGLTALTLLFSACAPQKTARQDAGRLGYLFTEYEGYYYEDASVLEEDDRVIIMDALTKHTDCPQLERDHALRLYALYLTAVREAIGETIPDDE